MIIISNGILLLFGIFFGILFERGLSVLWYDYDQ